MLAGKLVRDYASDKLSNTRGEYRQGREQTCEVCLHPDRDGEYEYQEHLDKITEPVDDPGNKEDMDTSIETSV
jgi:hypothetical protein